ncbi:MAG TPA: TetR/AcrR family transcriptional regulator C-terminal domain-containing protein [Dermatophilaceae bacterium]|nr:TetR/AcrR family transcriptional regulator C-terminal domain-containing protein [Dermatophilaceae bacterium]
MGPVAPGSKAGRARTARTARLSRETVLAAAVGLADRAGLAEVSMRTLAHDLGVVPMALYKHVANKDQLLAGMIDVVIAQIPSATSELGWKDAIRRQILAARQIMLNHPWASQLMASRTQVTPAVLGHMDAVIGTFLAGGFPPELAHQVMHSLGTRMWGFNLEVFPTAPPPDDPAIREAMLAQLAAAYPHIAAVAAAGSHDAAGIVGPGCDDQAEFEFGLDVLLDGFERLLTGGSHPA